MTENKKTVQKYMEGFIASDHEKILSCLTDDILWEMPGMFQLTGKAAFDKEIENDYFEGSPTIKLSGWLKKIILLSLKDRFNVT